MLLPYQIDQSFVIFHIFFTTIYTVCPKDKVTTVRQKKTFYVIYKFVQFYTKYTP